MPFGGGGVSGATWANIDRTEELNQYRLSRLASFSSSFSGHGLFVGWERGGGGDCGGTWAELLKKWRTEQLPFEPLGLLLIILQRGRLCRPVLILTGRLALRRTPRVLSFRSPARICSPSLGPPGCSRRIRPFALCGLFGPPSSGFQLGVLRGCEARTPILARGHLGDQVLVVPVHVGRAVRIQRQTAGEACMHGRWSELCPVSCVQGEI